MALNLPSMQQLATPVSSARRARMDRAALKAEEQNAVLRDQEIELNERRLAQGTAPDPKLLESFQKTSVELARQVRNYDQSLEDSGVPEKDRLPLVQEKWSQAIGTLSDTYGEPFGARFDPDAQYSRADVDAYLGEAESDIERVGQRIVASLGNKEAEVFRDKGTNELFIQDTKGNRQVVASADLTTPPERVLSGELPGGEAQALRDTETAAKNFVDTTGDALELLIANPDINTFVSRAASVVNNLQQEGMAMARQLGMEFDPGVLDPEGHKATFDQLGIDNQRMRSLITALSFQAAAATGQTGRAVSDRDVNRFIREIGADAADPRAFARVLKDVATRTVRNFKNSFSIRTKSEYEGDLGLSDLPEFATSEAPEGVDPELWDLMTPEEKALWQN